MVKIIHTMTDVQTEDVEDIGQCLASVSNHSRLTAIIFIMVHREHSGPTPHSICEELQSESKLFFLTSYF